MKRVPASGITIEGFDVYHGNAMPGLSGMAFAFLKASEGTGVTDPKFHARWTELKAAGIRRGAYHFFRPTEPPRDQAKHFASVLGALEPGDMPPVLDVEALDGLGPVAVGHLVMAYLDEMKQLMGRHAMIYGSPYFLEALQLPAGIPNALWVSHYGVSAPLVPSPWSHWDLWQYSDAGLDRDRFNGDLLSLERLIDRSKVASA